MRHSYIPNYTPPYGTTKTVLLTLKERKAIGRRKLAAYVAERLSLTGATSFIKSKGLFYSFSWLAGDVLQVKVKGAHIAPRIHKFTNFDDMVDYLFTFDECSLRRIEKIRIQRALDARSVQGTKEWLIFNDAARRLSESLV
jgi:hypothetical protein